MNQSRAEVQAMVQAAKSQGLQFFLPTDIFEFPDMLLERWGGVCPLLGAVAPWGACGALALC